jgi:hypothetical protein
VKLHRTVWIAWLVAVVALGCDGDTVITLVPEQLPPATVGQPYDVAVTPADNANSGLTLMLKSGALPPGISVYWPGGYGTVHNGLRGTPTSAGTFTFTVELAGRCTMGGCDRGVRDYTMVVTP